MRKGDALEAGRRTFEMPFLTGKAGIVLMRMVNDGIQVERTKTAIDAPFPACTTGTAPLYPIIGRLSFAPAAAEGCKTCDAHSE
jgi:hypothetical protein